jgi:hypothetical protein
MGYFLKIAFSWPCKIISQGEAGIAMSAQSAPARTFRECLMRPAVRKASASTFYPSRNRYERILPHPLALLASWLVRSQVGGFSPENDPLFPVRERR